MTVTNLHNGCTASDEVVMMEDTELPEVTLGYLDGTLDCAVREVAMSGTDIFPQEYTPLVSWMHAGTGEVVSSDVDPVFAAAGCTPWWSNSSKTAAPPASNRRRTCNPAWTCSRLERHGASQCDHA